MKKMDMLKDIVRAYKNYPDYVAFVIDDTSYTYQEVFARVRGIMPFVQDCPEDIIGIIAEDCTVIRENLRDSPPQLPGQPEQEHRGGYRHETGLVRS